MKTSNKMLIGLAVMMVVLATIQIIEMKHNISKTIEKELNNTVQESVIFE